MKILVASPEYFPDEVLSEFKEIATVDSRPLSREQLLNEIAEYDVVLTRVNVKFDKELLDRAKNLKVIATASAGTDHIDMDYAKSKGITVINLVGTNTTATAEHTFALILSLARKIPWASKSLLEGKWDRHLFFGSELEGKTLGVIGFGRIGSQVARYGKGFGMKILTFDPYIKNGLAQEIGAEITTLEDVFINSDIITIHAFLSTETDRMINANSFAMMKRKPFLINAARGDIIDEDALLDALYKGTISGAALDVFSEEPLSASSKLVEYAKTHDNLLITPHIAASTNETVIKSAAEIVKKTKELLLNQGLNQVGPRNDPNKPAVVDDR